MLADFHAWKEEFFTHRRLDAVAHLIGDWKTVQGSRFSTFWTPVLTDRKLALSSSAGGSIVVVKPTLALAVKGDK